MSDTPEQIGSFIGSSIAKMITKGIVIALIVFGFVMATLYLWNWLVPTLFAGPVITFWQAVGLLALSKLLFWGFSKGGHWGGRHGGPWRPYWKEKWNAMTPEDRERFKEKMKAKWCRPRQESSDVNSGGSIV